MLLSRAVLTRLQIHPGTGSAPAYRADIDGLRAVAVVPVLLFHAGVGLFSGGFVGVDVFFVISGYLITSIIWHEMTDDRFSLVAFYERRVRRIAPALLAVCAFTLAMGVFFYLPAELEALARKILAVLGFVANVAFALQTDYFAAPAETNPLLHTWSLAVEEQYYLFFPLLLLLIHRHARALVVPALGLITLGSLALSIVAVPFRPTEAFFLAPTRIWELCVGSLLALGVAPAITDRRAREAAAALGLLLITASVLLYDSATPFPGAAALLPVLGSALLIHCAEGTAAGRLLSARPLVFVGLISYSLYLWHWPIIVFSRHMLARDFSAPEILSLMVASLVAATLSWKWVEQPFRSRRKLDRRAIFTWAAAGAAAIAAAAIAIMMLEGVPGRFSREVLQFAAGSEDFSPARERCHRGEGNDPPIARSCIYGPSIAPQYAVWGDSHGVELAYLLGEQAADRGRSLIHLTYSSCPPALGYRAPTRRGCTAFNERAFRYLASSPTVHTVFLSALYDNSLFRTDPAFRNGIARTVRGLVRAGKRVVLIGPTPMHRYDVPQRLALHAAFGAGGPLSGEPTPDFLRRNREALDLIAGLAGPKVTIVYPHRRLCGSTCRLALNGRPLYFDNHHLSMTGARQLIPLFAPAFEPRAADLDQTARRRDPQAAGSS